MNSIDPPVELGTSNSLQSTVDRCGVAAREETIAQVGPEAEA
jgi:hypothetical protein